MDCRVKPGNDEINAATRFPLCAEPERLSASRPRLFGAAEFRSGAPDRRPVAAAHRGYRRRPAAGRNSRPRSMKTSPGSASPGRRRCGGNPSILPNTARRSRGCPPRVWSIRVSRAAPRLRRLVAQREAAARRGRAIPTARRSIPARRSCCRPTQRARLLESGAPYALRLDMAAACARAGDLGWTEQGEGPDGETGAVAARPQAWGDVILARKETPTSYHLSVVIDDALQGVTEVVRGQDLFWSTSVHRLLQRAARPAAAGLPAPPPDARWRRAKAVEIDRGHRLARTSRRRRDAGRHPPPGRPALIARRCKRSRGKPPPA